MTPKEAIITLQNRVVLRTLYDLEKQAPYSFRDSLHTRVPGLGRIFVDEEDQIDAIATLLYALASRNQRPAWHVGRAWYDWCITEYPAYIGHHMGPRSRVPREANRPTPKPKGYKLCAHIVGVLGSEKVKKALGHLYASEVEPPSHYRSNLYPDLVCLHSWSVLWKKIKTT